MTDRKRVIEKLKSTLSLDLDSKETAPLFENLESRLMLSTTSISVTTDTGVVSGTTFIDTDGDGVQDDNESGVEGLTTILYDSDGNTVASTTTDSDGAFSFEGLDTGTYTLVQELEDNYAQSIDDNEGPVLVSAKISNSSSSDLTSDSTPVFILTFSEEVSGDDTDIVLVNSDGDTITADSIEWDGTTATVTFSTALEDGDYTLEFNSQNITNTTTSEALVTTTDEILAFTLDTNAPTVTVTNLRTSNTSPTLQGYVTDTNATVYITINDKTYEADVSGYYWTLDLSDVDVELSSGRYNVWAEAVDEAGNVGSDTTTDELSIFMLDGSFEDYDLDSWTVVDQGGTSNWVVDDYGQLLQTYDIGSSSEDGDVGTMLIYANGDDYSDYSFFISLASTDSDGTIGLVFRYVDENNYYRFTIAADGTTLLEKCEDGTFTTLASGTMDFDLEETYSIEICAIGSYLEINLVDNYDGSTESSIDRENLLSAYDDTFSSGSFGFYSYNNSGAYFGDILVESQDGTDLAPIIEEVSASYSTASDLQSVVLSVNAMDPNTDDDLSYTWTIVSGSGSLENSDSSTTTYVPDDVTEDETVTIQITVSDGNTEVTETVTFTIVDGDVIELLSEDFSADDALDSWVTVDQSNRGDTVTWTLKNGNLVQTSNAYDSNTVFSVDQLGTYCYYTEGFWWDNYSVNLNVTTSDNDVYGVMVRYIDENNYYRFSWDGEKGCARLAKCVDGVFTILAEVDITYTSDQVYNLTISIDEDNTIEVSVDDEVIMEVTDDEADALTYGTIAMYTFGCSNTAFSDITVSNLNDVNPAPIIDSVESDSDRISDEETVTLTVDASDTNDTELTYTWSVDESVGTLTVSSDGTTATFTPTTVSETTTVTITVTVSDGEKTDTETIEITVVDADDILLQEDFSSDTLDSSWTEGGDDGDWTIENGQLVQNDNAGTIADSSAAQEGSYLVYDTGDETWEDYIVYLTMMSQDNDYIGVMFRYIDEDNYYRLSWSATEGLMLVKCVDGEFTVLYSDEDYNYETGEEYAVSISVVDQYIEITIDGETVISVSDQLEDGLSYGTIALYNNINAGSYYDDVVVIAQ